MRYLLKKKEYEIDEIIILFMKVKFYGNLVFLINDL